MKTSILLSLFLFSVQINFAQSDEVLSYQGVTTQDFDGKSKDAGVGQSTKVFFRFFPKKSSAVNTFFADNFEWHAFVEKTGKFYLTPELLANGFVLKINNKLERLGAFQARIYSREGGKIKSEKLSKKSIRKEEYGDSTSIHFSFEGFTKDHICEISYSTKGEIAATPIIIRGNELSMINYSKVEVLIPEFLKLDIDLTTTAIDNTMTREETIRESMKFDNYTDENGKPKIANETINYAAVKKTLFIDNSKSKRLSNISARVISKAPVFR